MSQFGQGGGSAFFEYVRNSKMTQFGQRGGVSIIPKCLKFKNVPKVGGGGGRVNPNWDIVPNFFDFLF